jgi:hypothetical protein
MGVWKTISNALYREYDRRIKRASLITEYGAAHHGAHGDSQEHTHDADEHVEEAEIVNVPRGTPVAASPAVSEQSPAEH